MANEKIECFYDICQSNQFIMVLDVIDGKTCFNRNLLSYIARNKNIEAQAYFTNVDPSSLVDDYGCTLLHWAVYYKNKEMAQYFIDKGCNVDATDNEGNTLLKYAIRNCDFPMIKVLLDSNANVFLCNKNGTNVLHKIFKYLLALDKSITEMVFETTKKQCSNNSRTLAEKLLEFNFTIPQAIPFKDITATEFMLKFGCTIDDRDSYGNSALHYAVAMTDLEHVEMLVQNGIDVQIKNNIGRGPLHLYNTAFENTEEELEILNILMNQGASLPAGPYGNCMLEENLFKTGKKKLIKTLLQWNVDFATNDENGKTLLHIICANDNPGVTNLLRGLKLNVNSRDRLGRTALWDAVESNNFQMLEFLLQNRAAVNATDDIGKTVLFHGFTIWQFQCKTEPSLKCFELLLQYKADIQYVCDKFKMIFTQDMPRYDIVFTLLAHLRMMEALGDPLDDFVLRRFLNHENRTFTHYFNFCGRQIVNMMNTMVYEFITVFDILTTSRRKLALYLRNRGFAFRLKTVMWQVRKPNTENNCENDCSAVAYYNRIYWGRVIEAKRCAELIEPAGSVLARALNLNYNHCIMDEILSHLDSRDLQNICLTNFYKF